MATVLDELKARLKGKRFGVVGIGNVVRGDDGAGPALAALLEGRAAFPSVDAAEVPENYGGWIVKQHLEAAVFVDAVAFGGPPGEIRIVPFEKLMVSASNTHRLSLHLMVEYLNTQWEGEEILVGIQPKSLAVGEGLSEEVAAAVRALADALLAAGDESGRGA